MVRRRRAVVVGAVAALLPVCAPVAQAATVFGSDFASPLDPEPVACLSISCTAVMQGLQGAVPLTAPADGVIVAWKVRSATAGLASLVVVRGAGPFTLVLASSLTTILPGTTTHQARISVRAGDRLALQATDEIPAVFAVSASGSAALVEGAAEPYIAQASIGAELQVQAVLEPDADRDGLGDETQDRCLGVAAFVPCASLHLSASGPDVVAPGGGDVTHVLKVRNDAAHPIGPVGVTVRPHRWGTSPAIQGCTAVVGFPCGFPVLGPGEEREVVVAYGRRAGVVRTDVEVEPAGGAWLVRRSSSSGPMTGGVLQASMHTEEARRSDLRMDIHPVNDVMRIDRAEVDLVCPFVDVGPCEATVEVRTAWRPKGAPRPRVLFRRTVRVPAADQRLLRLRFSRSAMRYLRSRHTTKVQVRATRVFATGRATGTARMTLRAPRRR